MSTFYLYLYLRHGMSATSFTFKKRVGSWGFCLLPQTFGKVGVECMMFFSLKVKNSIPRNRDRQRSTKIAVEGTIFAFDFSKKYDLSLLSIGCRVLDRCRAFDRLVSVDAHLWIEQERRCLRQVADFRPSKGQAAAAQHTTSIKR